MSEVRKNTVYLGLGSNVGNRTRNITSAIDNITELDDSALESVSSLYESEPYGNTEQRKFLNAVIKIITALDHMALLYELKSIEKKIGRKKRGKWGPREIDIDILFYNDLVFSDEIITLPHKGIINRDFVLIPLAEIEPGLIHPVFGKKAVDFISELKIKYILKKIPFIYKINPDL